MLSGFKLKMLRLHKDMTQQYIADCLNVSKNYISMLEGQKQAIPEELYPLWIDALNGIIVPKPKEIEQEIIQEKKKKPGKKRG
ncbi:helix-turn-helix transcriptional regulator [Clostridium sp. BNL1100]|uniref:helix-turn-helix domain-containing protein n=1 Tax=Clostridium sp. BNL1100 TaxID=755731 RepID=UPI00024A7766|nr:helix-turn-helix transcriptional regulator [Clostridium sp. BNL1100]AEY67845.1 Helix-turn-helix protein [Clostridium sp. BNL1100]